MSSTKLHPMFSGGCRAVSCRIVSFSLFMAVLRSMVKYHESLEMRINEVSLPNAFISMDRRTERIRK